MDKLKCWQEKVNYRPVLYPSSYTHVPCSYLKNITKSIYDRYDYIVIFEI